MTDTLPIYEQTRAARYDPPNATQRHPTPSGGPPVSLLDTLRSEVARAVTWTEDELRSKLPTVAKLADDADAIANSAPVQAILGAVLSPADEELLVGLVNRLDQSAHQAEASAEAEQLPEAPAAPEAEPEPPAASIFTPQPGPVVGGTAR